MYTFTNNITGEIFTMNNVELFWEIAHDEHECYGGYLHKNSRMDWELLPSEQPDEDLEFDDDDDYWGSEVGYNPYMGGYDWDC